MISRQPLRSLLRSKFLRYESKSSNVSIPRRSDAALESSVLIEDSYVKNALWSIDVFRRWFKFSLVGVFVVGATTLTAYEGVHAWVEHVELVANHDQETKRFEWDQEVEKWSGVETGGSDPAMGWKGRHAVRSAWIAQNWGTGLGTPVIRPDTLRVQGTGQSGRFNAVDARLEYARDFLNTAISVAEERMASGRLHPLTLVNLLARHADVLERIDTRSTLLESRTQYERVWAGLPGKGINSARTATKIGDLSHRLGESEEALAWWARAIHLSQGNAKAQHVFMPPSVPTLPPPSPLAQRTLASALVSLSAFYATSGQLSDAQAIQTASLDLLRSIPTPKSSAFSSPPEALHALYLLHRSSLVSIHHAEVLFALRHPIQSSMQWLKDAAQSSERVVEALTGQPAIPQNTIPPSLSSQPPSKGSLLSSYSKSRVLNKPATSLLQSAKRSAAEAWNLLGILGESHGSDAKKVLYCYERALGWASAGTKGADDRTEPGDGMTEFEWKALRTNYVRAKEAVHNEKEKS